MTSAVEQLMDFAKADNRFDIPHAELRDVQLQALNERFQERKGRIKLLRHRAEEAGIDEVRSLADVVPLLFPHTAYKSYPESWLVEEKWDRLTKWLSTISPYPVEGVDLDGITDIDDWIERLAAKGYYISCSSGTTGKSAMLPASAKDMDWSRVDTVATFSWGSGVKPEQNRCFIGTGPVAHVPKNIIIGEARQAAFGDPARPAFRYPVPPLTVGSLTKMVVLRKAIAEGTARPDQIADFEKTTQERAEIMEQAVGIAADAAVEYREERLHFGGLWNNLYQVAKAVREKGYSAKDFNSDNSIYVGGGLKRAQLPADYQQFVYETFNIPPERNFQNYSMQELNSAMPKCHEGGRYHLPPWIVPILLDKSGDAAIDHGYSGEVEGRAAFFDLSLDGRWGGVITGDEISIDFGPCGCGQKGPTIRDNIARYADLEGDDKIGCADTVDAYVRGVS